MPSTGRTIHVHIFDNGKHSSFPGLAHFKSYIQYVLLLFPVKPCYIFRHWIRWERMISWTSTPFPPEGQSKKGCYGLGYLCPCISQTQLSELHVSVTNGLLQFQSQGWDEGALDWSAEPPFNCFPLRPLKGIPEAKEARSLTKHNPKSVHCIIYEVILKFLGKIFEYSV